MYDHTVTAREERRRTNSTSPTVYPADSLIPPQPSRKPKRHKTPQPTLMPSGAPVSEEDNDGTDDGENENTPDSEPTAPIAPGAPSDGRQSPAREAPYEDPNENSINSSPTIAPISSDSVTMKPSPYVAPSSSLSDDVIDEEGKSQGIEPVAPSVPVTTVAPVPKRMTQRPYKPPMTTIDETNKPTLRPTSFSVTSLTFPPTQEKIDTLQPTAEYVRIDDDPILEQEIKQEEEKEEHGIEQVETEAKTAGGIGFLLAIFAMIFTAYQMSENPDGIYASVCRLAITIVGCGIKLILMPCRNLLGNRYHAGHIPVSTLEYREPYRGGSTGIEMS